jgi:hypothetical protein
MERARRAGWGRLLAPALLVLGASFVFAVAVDAIPDRRDSRSALPAKRRPARLAHAGDVGRARSTRNLLPPGSRPSVLPSDVLIADRGNNRIIQVNPRGSVVWRFPRPGDLHNGQTFEVPDDAFYDRSGRRIVATQEDNFLISVIDAARHRIAYRYGVAGVPGSGPNRLYNPDDAMLVADGRIFSSDIKNCRLLVLRPPLHTPVRQFGNRSCVHDPPRSYASPNGAFPLHDGGTVVTEIGGDWIDVLGPSGRLVLATHPPGFSYPSDTNEVRPGLFLSADYTSPGAIETFDRSGAVRWRFAPQGKNALDHPSLALPLPNGDVLANDDYNDRVIVIDPRTSRIVWQYGHTGRPGSRAGYLSTPDGVDLAPPHALLDRFPRARPPERQASPAHRFSLSDHGFPPLSR